MPVKIMIDIDIIGDKTVSQTQCKKATLQEMSLALTHIKIREKDLLEMFQKNTMTWKDSNEK